MGMIARNAQRIVDARKNGLKPKEITLVSLIGPIGERNHTVYANASKAYDWRWVHGLEICMYATKGVDWRPTARSIASERPSLFMIWDTDCKEGAYVYLIPRPDDIGKPVTEWRLQLDFLPWLPFENETFAWN